MITQHDIEIVDDIMYKKDEYKRQTYTPTLSDSDEDENYLTHGIGGSQALLVGPDQ
jgi:hypothetical protein